MEVSLKEGSSGVFSAFLSSWFVKRRKFTNPIFRWWDRKKMGKLWREKVGRRAANEGRRTSSVALKRDAVIEPFDAC